MDLARDKGGSIHVKSAKIAAQGGAGILDHISAGAQQVCILNPLNFPGPIISICVAMFFVIVFSHIDIRGKISAQEIFYLEYFFFLTYASILYVVFNAGGAILKFEIPFCNYKSRGPRLLFWPVFLGTVFLVTMTVFLRI